MSRLRVIDSAESEARLARVARLVPHPVLEWFPEIDLDLLADLSFDVQIHGQRDPIVVHGDQVLDGRGRLRACEMARVEPELVEWGGTEDEIPAFIIAKNLHRRHLDTSQRALIAARVAESGVGIPTGAAARMLNVSRDSTQEGKVVLRSGDPELVARVEAGELAVSAAAERVRELERARQVVARATPAELRQVLAGQAPRDVRAAVRTPRRVNDAYYTPDRVAEACVDVLRVPYGTRALEPSVGGGAWARALGGGRASLTVLDLDPEAVGLAFGDEQLVGDFLTRDFGGDRFDLVIGNPPYDQAEAHVRRALELLAPRGRLAFLLRRNWAAPARFGLLLDELRAPAEEWILGPRVSFTGDGTDSQEYSLFVWHAGEERISWTTYPLRWRT